MQEHKLLKSNLKTTEVLPLLLSSSAGYCLHFSCSKLSYESVLFLIKPVAYVVGFILGSNCVNIADEGFFLPQLEILIDKSCSGYNFWSVCIFILTYLCFTKIAKLQIKCFAFLLLLPITYLLTLFVNTIRIISCISTAKLGLMFSENYQGIIHEVTGLANTVVFLLLFYFAFGKIINYSKYAH